MKAEFFKAALLKLFALSVSTIAFSQTPSQTENYIYIQEPTVGVTAVTDATNAIRTVQYFDGLGRPKQTVQIKASPDQGTTNSPKNLVTKYDYDGFGRQVLDFLPVPLTNQSDALITLDSEYNSSKTSQYSNQNHYSEKTLENSPLNRVMKQAAPGNDWAKGSGHEIEFTYQTNSSTEVLIYWVDGSGNIKRGGYSGKTHYPANSLYKTTTMDENGNKIHEFKNKQGQVVLKRTTVTTPTAAGRGTGPGDVTGIIQSVDTYYAYDVYGNLVAVIPPLAATKATITSTIQSNLCFTYKYDDRNRLIEKTLPGKGVEYMVYDKQDRLVATQDANLRNNGGEWLFTKYDKFGRIAYTGIYNGGTNRLTVQNAANGAANNNNESRNDTGFTKNGISVKYTNTAFPTTINEVSSVNYYDYYGNIGFTAPASVLGNNQIRRGNLSDDANNSVKGLQVASLVRILGTDDWESSFTVYDRKSRPVQTYKQNHLGGFTETSSVLTFRGQPTTTQTRHKFSSTTPTQQLVTVTDYFTYDNMERLLTHKQTLGTNLTRNLISSNKYDKLGQLITKNVGGTATAETDRWQEINYAYNIRGWLTSINDVGLLLQGKDMVPPGMGDDLFAFRISYNSIAANGSEYTDKLYNGNIAQTFWKTSTDNILRGYNYKYDQLNRLLNAEFYRAGVPITGAYSEYLRYDVNGNITNLVRHGGDPAHAQIDMDNLTYTYQAGNTNSNRLMRVEDGVSYGSDKGFTNGNIGTDDYAYDANGNMILDKNKGITEIFYNYLNLPEYISLGSKGVIEYIYNAAGQKVKKRVYDNTVTPNTIKDVHYLDGFQYAGDVLQFFPTSEGYVSVTLSASSLGGTTGTYLYNYVYNYTDHLGNIRMSFTKDPVNNQLKILEENHYYPFGLKHMVYADGKQKYQLVDDLENTARPSFVYKTDYQYKYNDKEFQDELSLNWYDYGARNYDPALGRWNVIDPMADKYWMDSPYAYVLNNPVYFIDPDGMQVDTGDPDICEGCVVELEEAVITAEVPKKKEENRDPLFGFNYDSKELKENMFAVDNAVANYKAAQQIDAIIHEITFAIVTAPLGGPIARGASFLLKPIVTKTGTVVWKLVSSKAVAEGIEHAAVSKFLVNPTKFDYFFGRVISGDAHNVARSAQNLKDLTSLGITNESQLMKVFGQAIESGTVLSTKTNQFGTTVTRSINIGDKGAVNVGFFYKGGNMNSTPSISTIIPKIFK